MWVVIIPIAAIVLYLWMIMPTILRRKDLRPLTVGFFAHRGLYNKEENVPENSFMAFQKAVERGFGIELDVQLTKDEVPVVIHDNDLQRVCGKRYMVSGLKYEQLRKYPLLGTRERVPLLSDVLHLVNGKVPLIIEIKSESKNMLVCRKTMQVLQKYKGDYVVESFNPLVLLWFRLHHPDIVRGQLATDFKREGQKGNWLLFFLMKHLVFNFITKPDFIAINHLYKKTASYKICKKLYKTPIVAWNIGSKGDYIRNEKEFESYIFSGFLPDKVARL